MQNNRRGLGCWYQVAAQTISPRDLSYTEYADCVLVSMHWRVIDQVNSLIDDSLLASPPLPINLQLVVNDKCYGPAPHKKIDLPGLVQVVVISLAATPPRFKFVAPSAQTIIYSGFKFGISHLRRLHRPGQLTMLVNQEGGLMLNDDFELEGTMVETSPNGQIRRIVAPSALYEEVIDRQREFIYGGDN